MGSRLRPLNVASPAMAGYQRTATLKDPDQMEKLVKDHIGHELDPIRQPGLWQSKDLDNVVSHYQEFLAGMAQLGLLLEQLVFLKVLKKQFAGDPIILKNFAEVMCRCLMHCKRKTKGISSGAKTSAAVLRVTKVWAIAQSRQQSSSSLQSSDTQPRPDTQLSARLRQY